MLTSFQAAKITAEAVDWSVTNLRLQKMLYIAHMYYTGENKQPLIGEAFQAWAYGPVLPTLYHELKVFRAKNIKPSAFRHVADVSVDSPERAHVVEMANFLRKYETSQLIGITHRLNAAWSKSYKPRIRNIEIPTAAIIQEYEDFYNDEE